MWGPNPQPWDQKSRAPPTKPARQARSLQILKNYIYNMKKSRKNPNLNPFLPFPPKNFKPLKILNR